MRYVRSLVLSVSAAGVIAVSIAGMPLGTSHGAAAPEATAGPITAPSTNGAAPAMPAVPAEDIRDIRGPKFLAREWLIPALIAALALLTLIAYGVWRWRRRRRRPRILLPFELALQRLEEIRSLMQPAHAREFSIAASDIVRGYIEERFNVTATHRTTEEFLHDLLNSPNLTLARHRGLLEEFLNQCDLVKFAGISLSVENMESLHRSACAFVRETAAPDPVVVPGKREAHDTLSAT